MPLFTWRTGSADALIAVVVWRGTRWRRLVTAARLWRQQHKYNKYALIARQYECQDMSIIYTCMYIVPLRADTLHKSHVFVVLVVVILLFSSCLIGVCFGFCCRIEWSHLWSCVSGAASISCRGRLTEYTLNRGFEFNLHVADSVLKNYPRIMSM